MSVQEKFLAAVDIIDSLPSDGTFQPSEDLMLKLYAYYMQATHGPCTIPKPCIWYYSERIKWNAWNDLGDMQREVAMEKYVEELTKVIETMSYNEHVSRFMSLIGPFYEVVSVDEVDVLSEKKGSDRSHVEFPYPVKNVEDFQILKIEHSEINSFPQNNFPGDFSSSLHESPCTGSAKHCKYDPTSLQTSPLLPKQNVIDIFKTKTNLKNQPHVSQQDILILTIINLQNSLEEIGKKLDNLQTLARSADLNYEIKNEAKKPKEWNLTYSGTAFALLWPVAVHLCSNGF